MFSFLTLCVKLILSPSDWLPTNLKHNQIGKNGNMKIKEEYNAMPIVDAVERNSVKCILLL